MAQPATSPAQASDTGTTKHGGRATEARAAIPLDLGPLLAPYKKRGRLAIRVEQMPPLARLSAGRNNGDNSWSLGSDELEELSFQPPPGFDQPHKLAIRIMVHDTAGVATAAVLDYEISPDGGVAAPMPVNTGTDDEASAQLRRLEVELAEMADQLDQRETALTAAKEDAEAARMALELARESWEKDEDKRLSAARADWQREADAALSRMQKTVERGRATEEREQTRLKDELESVRKELAAREAELSEAQASQTKIETAAARAQRDALRKAEESRKAEEAKRLVAAKAEWQREHDAALAEARTSANQTRAAEASEQRRLTDELARLHKAVSARDAEMTRLRATMINAEAEAVRAQREALRKAEEQWKSEEAARHDAAEAAWRAEMETACAEARAEGEKTGSDAQDKIPRLHEELASLGKRLADREAELEALCASGGDADRDGELREALAAAEEKWKEQSAREQADLRARCERAEAELEDRTLRATADAAELKRLQDEWRAAQNALAERDAEVEQMRAAATEATVPAPSTQAVTEIEAALEEATARYEAAETALIDLRRRTGPQAATDMALLRDEVETLQTMLAQREEEMARLRIAADRWHDYQEQGAVAEARRTTKRKPRKYVEDDEPEAPRKAGLLRDVALVAAVAVAGVMFTPKIVTSLPYKWQAQLPAFLQPAEDDGSDATAANTVPAPAASSAPARPMAIILHGVNLRAGPSSQSKVIETLKRGTVVDELGQQRNWHHVRTTVTAGGGVAVSGWVYQSYLKLEDNSAKAAAPKG